jgi:hypothetical protein
MTDQLTGSCQCGAVTFAVTAAPLLTYACHCQSCQKRTGSAFSMGLIVLTDSLQVSGELSTWSRTSDEGNTNTRYSCADCGNIIYGIGEPNTELAKLQAGILAETTDIEPEVHIWTCRKQRWFDIPTGAPQFEQQADAMTLLQAAQDYRGRS